MTIDLKKPELRELRPRITVFGVGGGGSNAVNNMIESGLEGVEFVAANTDAQALSMSKADKVVQLGISITEGLGAGSQPDVGRAAAEEAVDEICEHLADSHMVFVAAGMGGGTGTGAAPVVAKIARERGVLTVAVVTKPFTFEGSRRSKIADEGIKELHKNVDTLIVIPNQNLFRVSNEKTTFTDAFALADHVLYSGVACITDLMVKEGLINLDFADVRTIMRDMGKAMMGTGEAEGDDRAIQAAEGAIANPLLDETSMRGARGVLISITGGDDLTLFEVDAAASRIREEVDENANIIVGATFNQELNGKIRVSVVATGVDAEHIQKTIDNSSDQKKDINQAKKQPCSIPLNSNISQLDHNLSISEAVSKKLSTPIYQSSHTDTTNNQKAVSVIDVQEVEPDITIKRKLKPAQMNTIEVSDQTLFNQKNTSNNQVYSSAPLPNEQSSSLASKELQYKTKVLPRTNKIPSISEFPPIGRKVYHGKTSPLKTNGLLKRIAQLRNFVSPNSKNKTADIANNQSDKNNNEPTISSRVIARQNNIIEKQTNLKEPTFTQEEINYVDNNVNKRTKHKQLDTTIDIPSFLKK